MYDPEVAKHWVECVVVYGDDPKAFTANRFAYWRPEWGDWWVTYLGNEAPFPIDGSAVSTTVDRFARYGTINGIPYGIADDPEYAALLWSCARKSGGKHTRIECRSDLDQ